ncbi:MAG TPA: nuclear transport factor 2 family protein [Acidisphaera sp.]|nr:nuclear transport factor 2 family protein [Acidisphaera sp.]
MTDLPYADAATRAALLAWLDRFAGQVRAVDYAAAAPLFHPDVLAFGTHRDVIPGLAAWIRTQWDNVWPRTADFRFDLDATRILASPDGRMAVAVAPWTSTGFAQDGTRFDRPGRATMVFEHTEAGWLCVHSHMSLNRGVPQTSHADRTVKAWPAGIEPTGP